MPLSLALIAVCLTSLAAAYVGSYLGRASASSQLRNRLRELETEVASLASEYSKVMGLAKKISQRVALDQHRQNRATTTGPESNSPPPPGDKKAAQAHYLHGKTHQQIALAAMNGATK